MDRSKTEVLFSEGQYLVVGNKIAQFHEKTGKLSELNYEGVTPYKLNMEGESCFLVKNIKYHNDNSELYINLGKRFLDNIYFSEIIDLLEVGQEIIIDEKYHFKSNCFSEKTIEEMTDFMNASIKSLTLIVSEEINNQKCMLFKLNYKWFPE